MLPTRLALASFGGLTVAGLISCSCGEEQPFDEKRTIDLSFLSEPLPEGELTFEQCAQLCVGVVERCREIARELDSGFGDSGFGDSGFGDSGFGDTAGSDSGSGQTGTITVRCEGTRPYMCEGRPPRNVRRSTKNITGVGAWAASAAQGEAASVVAFRELALGLRDLGAPTELIQAARRAATDEARHARAMRKLAANHGVVAPKPRRRAPRPYRTLRGLALHNAAAGVVHESESLLVTAWLAEFSQSAAVRTTLRPIVRDELGHVLLAAAIERWAIGRDPRLGELVIRRRLSLRPASG